MKSASAKRPSAHARVAKCDVGLGKQPPQLSQRRDSHHGIADPVGSANHYIFRVELIHRLQSQKIFHSSFLISHLSFKNNFRRFVVARTETIVLK